MMLGQAWMWESLPYHLTLLDAAPFQKVLNQIRRRLPLREIAEATGVSRYELTEISVGHRTRIRRDTAEKLRRGLVELLPMKATT